MDRIALHWFMVGHRFGRSVEYIGRWQPPICTGMRRDHPQFELIFDTVKSFRNRPTLLLGPFAPLSWDGPESRH